jgi:hypothetical protein
MFHNRICAFLLIVFVGTTGLLAQSTKKPLTNADVIEMVQAGLGESTVLLAIKNSGTNFDTSPQALIEMKKKGVSQNIMNAMLSAGNGSPGASPVSANNADGRALMAKVVNALGGEKNVNAVKSVRIQSTREVKTPALNTTLDLIFTAVYPDRVHVAIKSPQFSNVSVYQPNGAFVLVGGQVDQRKSDKSIVQFWRFRGKENRRDGTWTRYQERLSESLE